MKLYFAGVTKEPSFGIPEVSERQLDREQRSPTHFSSLCSFRGWRVAGSLSRIVRGIRRNRKKNKTFKTD